MIFFLSNNGRRITGTIRAAIIAVINFNYHNAKPTECKTDMKSLKLIRTTFTAAFLKYCDISKAALLKLHWLKFHSRSNRLRGGGLAGFRVNPAKRGPARNDVVW